MTLAFHPVKQGIYPVLKAAISERVIIFISQMKLKLSFLTTMPEGRVGS